MSEWNETIDGKNYRVIAELRSQLAALTQRAEQAERERDEAQANLEEKYKTKSKEGK